MEFHEEEGELGETILNHLEAQQYAGAKWRKPTAEELDEVAQYYAEDAIKGDMILDQEDKDETEFFIAVSREKEIILNEISPLAMVMDLVNIEAKIFYTFNFGIHVGTISHTLSFEDGLCKLLKYNGRFKDVSGLDYFDL